MWDVLLWLIRRIISRICCLIESFSSCRSCNIVTVIVVHSYFPAGASTCFAPNDSNQGPRRSQNWTNILLNKWKCCFIMCKYANKQLFLTCSPSRLIMCQYSVGSSCQQVAKWSIHESRIRFRLKCMLSWNDRFSELIAWNAMCTLDLLTSKRLFTYHSSTASLLRL